MPVAVRTRTTAASSTIGAESGTRIVSIQNLRRCQTTEIADPVRPCESFPFIDPLVFQTINRRTFGSSRIGSIIRTSSPDPEAKVQFSYCRFLLALLGFHQQSHVFSLVERTRQALAESSRSRIRIHQMISLSAGQCPLAYGSSLFSLCTALSHGYSLSLHRGGRACISSTGICTCLYRIVPMQPKRALLDPSRW